MNVGKSITVQEVVFAAAAQARTGKVFYRSTRLGWGESKVNIEVSKDDVTT